MARMDLDTSRFSAATGCDLQETSPGALPCRSEPVCIASVFRAPSPPNPIPMGKIVKCRECGKVYRELDELEDLRDNDSVCLVCNNTIEVPDWDRILASYEDDEGDVDDEDDWEEDEEAESKDEAEEETAAEEFAEDGGEDEEEEEDDDEDDDDEDEDDEDEDEDDEFDDPDEDDDDFDDDDEEDFDDEDE